MKPLVSIAIATYNGERFLEEQLKSIYTQTYKNFEVVVSDDISDDKTNEILRKYEKLYQLKYWINKTKLGITKNFERAISQCKGKYIYLSDQDDIWYPEKIERLLNNIGSASMIYSDGLIYDKENQLEKNRISSEKWIKPFGVDSSNKDFHKYVFLNSFILGCSLMFDREILKKAVPFYESDLNHDWWLVLCASTYNGVKYLDEVLFEYRVHGENYSMVRAKGKKSFYNRIVLFFWFDTKRDRQTRKQVIKYSMERLTPNMNRDFTSDMIRYCETGKNVLDVRSMWYVFKYRKFFFPNFSEFKKGFAIITSLFK